jgi:uncharacterized protein (TIGR02453 family)
MLGAVFAGFPPEALTFYEGLTADNTKAYWDANRETYEDAVREPMEELIAELAPEFGAAKVFRPYRDVRFSKDKSPYKTAQGALFREDGHDGSSRYVQVDAGGLWAGGGRYHPDTTQLGRIRRAIADQPGAELERIRAELEHAGLEYMKPELKTAPRGYPRDHPRIDLLRCKSHAALVRLDAGPWLHEAAAKDRVAEIFRTVTPLVEWLERHGGPPEPRER